MSSTTICMTDTSVIPFPSLGSTYMPPSNATTGSHPHVPCRSTRSSPPLTFSDTSDSNTSELSDNADDALQTRSATFVRYDSGSSSSSSTHSDEIPPTIVPRSKRGASQRSIAVDALDIFNHVSPASTPIKSKHHGRLSSDLETKKQTPLYDPSDEEDTVRPYPALRPFCKVGRLRLEGSTGKHVRHASDSNVTPRLVAGTPSASQSPQTVRKKSGQPVKSSLKSSRRPELHVVTNGTFAKSEPATPTHKAVHFDSKLEHVKLFLAEQKPLAVSRDGSPTSDTSGDEFPSFIYGDANRNDKRVKMLLPNMPSSPRKEEHVALQELILSQDQRTVTGNVRVRNIAYEKWLAIRFTLDWWQTTSEVTARYERSIEGGAFDMFSFTIRLHDIWSRIEEKTIVVALRYTVAGREYWDNNAGKNYHVKFVLENPLESSSAVDDASLKDLNSKLEGLAKTRSAPIPVTPYRLGRSFSADHQYASFAKPLSSRYDFASAYKTLKNTSSSAIRTRAPPPGVPVTAGPTAAPWSQASKADVGEKTDPPRSRLPSLSLASLRDEVDSTPPPVARTETKPTLPESPTPARVQDGRERNHRRTFAERVTESPQVRRTPPGSPLKFDATNSAAALPRTRSFPLIGEKQGAAKPSLSIQIAAVANGDRDGDGGSDASTPYEASQSSRSTDSSCTPLLSPGSELPRNDTSYKQFLDRFCFYTGGDSAVQASDTLPRSQSTSGIDHYFLSQSPPPSFSSHVRDVPERFPFDQATPTAVRV